MIVEIVKRFKKDFHGSPAHIQKRVLDIIRALENSDDLESSGLDVTYMQGQKKDENYYRIRVGDWRIGCQLESPNILLLRLLSRGEIYKHFPPK